MYAPQPAIMAEMFPTRMRYSGVSLGYQVTSIVAGSLAPAIATWLLDEFGSWVPIAVYLAGAAVDHAGRRAVHPGDQGPRPEDARRGRPRSNSPRRASHDANSTDAPRWSPAVRAASARRARETGRARSDGHRRRPRRRRRQGARRGDRWKGLGGGPFRCRRRSRTCSSRRHPGQQRRGPEHQPDRRVPARALPRHDDADGGGAVPVDPGRAAAHVRSRTSGASSTSRRCTGCAPREFKVAYVDRQARASRACRR